MLNSIDAILYSFLIMIVKIVVGYFKHDEGSNEM